MFNFSVLLSGFFAVSYEILIQRIFSQNFASDATISMWVSSLFLIAYAIGFISLNYFTGKYFTNLLRLDFLVLIIAISSLVALIFTKFVLYSSVSGYLLASCLLFVPFYFMGLESAYLIYLSKALSINTNFVWASNLLGAGLAPIVTTFIGIPFFGIFYFSIILFFIELLAFYILFSSLMVKRAYASINLKKKSLILHRVELIIGFSMIAYQFLLFKYSQLYLSTTAYSFATLLALYLITASVGCYLRFSNRISIFIISLFILVLPFLHLLLNTLRYDVGVFYFEPTKYGFEIFTTYILVVVLISFLLIPVFLLSNIYSNIIFNKIDSYDRMNSLVIGNMIAGFSFFLAMEFISVVNLYLIFVLSLASSLIYILLNNLSAHKFSMFNYRSASPKIIILVCFLIFFVFYVKIQADSFYNSINVRNSFGHWTHPLDYEDSSKSFSFIHETSSDKEFPLLISNGGIVPIGSISVENNVQFETSNIFRLIFKQQVLASKTFDFSSFVIGIANMGFLNIHEVTSSLGLNSTMHIYELDPSVVRYINKFSNLKYKYPDFAHDLNVGDGRRGLKDSNSKYDFIEIAVSRSTLSGSANIYSIDFIREALGRVKAYGGVFGYAYPLVLGELTRNQIPFIVMQSHTGKSYFFATNSFSLIEKLFESFKMEGYLVNCYLNCSSKLIVYNSDFINKFVQCLPRQSDDFPSSEYFMTIDGHLKDCTKAYKQNSFSQSLHKIDERDVSKQLMLINRE